MIRQITKYDKTSIVQMIQQFGKECPIEYYNNLEELHIVKLLDNILAGMGIGYIEENKGLILGIIVPTTWNPKVLMLHELAWYVKPEFRNTPIGYRLLKKYIEYGNELKDSGRIKMFLMGRFDSSPNIKYEKFGFKKLEESWVQ